MCGCGAAGGAGDVPGGEEGRGEEEVEEGGEEGREVSA